MSNVDLYLRQTYARVHDEPIYDHTSPILVDEDDPDEVIDTTPYYTGTNLYRANIQSKSHDDIVTLVIPGLRNVYYQSKHLLDAEEQHPLSSSMSAESPTFEYDTSSPPGLERFHLTGQVTPYDVVHIPVSKYLNLVNSRRTLNFDLVPTDITLRLTHTDADFWDPVNNTLARQ